MKAFLVSDADSNFGVVMADSPREVAKILGGVYDSDSNSIKIPASKFTAKYPERPHFCEFRRGPFFFTTFAGKDAEISLEEVPFFIKIESPA